MVFNIRGANGNHPSVGVVFVDLAAERRPYSGRGREHYRHEMLPCRERK